MTMQIVVMLNWGILFLVELAMLAGFFMFGLSLHIPTALRILTALAIPSGVIVLWGMYFSSEATYDLAQPWNALGEYTLFALAGLAIIASGRKRSGLIFIAVAFVSETIALLQK